MNIFVVDSDPDVAAQSLCDKHIVKMVLESAQLLCAPFSPGTAPYKRTHFNHPCAAWVRASIANYAWLLEHARALEREYRFRFGRDHACVDVIAWCRRHARKSGVPRGPLTPFAQAMPEVYRVAGDAVAAYRSYYIAEKAYMARWNRGRKPPPWWPANL
jgi:hypothetical protein